MRLRRARTRTRRLPETLPLACHDAVSGAPRATWENTRVERGSTRVLEGANGTGSGALVLANVLRVSRQGFVWPELEKDRLLSSSWPVVMVAVITAATITVTNIRSRSRSSSLSSPSAPPHHWWSCLFFGWSCLLFGVALFSFSAVLFTFCVVLFTCLVGPV